MTEGTYCVCDRCARKLEGDTLTCNQCGIHMPAAAPNYRPTLTEQVMTERGLIQIRATRPTVEERAAFRRQQGVRP